MRRRRCGSGRGGARRYRSPYCWAIARDNCTGFRGLHARGRVHRTGLTKAVGGVVEGDVKFKVIFLVCFVCACVN